MKDWTAADGPAVPAPGATSGGRTENRTRIAEFALSRPCPAPALGGLRNAPVRRTEQQRPAIDTSR